MNWFKGLYTVEAVKSLYRKLAKQYHPDLGGDTATMQKINAAYHAKLESLNGAQSTDDKGRQHTYKYDSGLEEEIIQKIHELMKLDGLEISLVGTWIWISGETKRWKDTLKTQRDEAGNKIGGLDCIWHGKHKMWYWRREDCRVNRSSKGDFNDIAAKYGCKTFYATGENDKAIA